MDSNLATFAQADVVLVAARLLSARSPAGWAATTSPESLAILARAAGGDADFAATLETAVTAAGRIDRRGWVHERTRLFEAGVVCPVNETGYIRRDKGAIIADICGFYRAFGLEPREGAGEKADHLVSELEFVGALLVMMGKAEAVADADRVAVVQSAIRSFLADHLGEWIGLFCHRLVQTTELELFDATAELLRATWNLLARRFALPSFDALDAEADPTGDDGGTPYECDMADAACPLQSLADARRDDGALD